MIFRKVLLNNHMKTLIVMTMETTSHNYLKRLEA